MESDSHRHSNQPILIFLLTIQKKIVSILSIILRPFLKIITFIKSNILKKENGKNHYLYNKRVWAVAKCESGNKVLYLTGNEKGEDTYYVFHLTYSEYSTGKFPDYEELGDLRAVKEYMEKCNR